MLKIVQELHGLPKRVPDLGNLSEIILDMDLDSSKSNAVKRVGRLWEAEFSEKHPFNPEPKSFNKARDAFIAKMGSVLVKSYNANSPQYEDIIKFYKDVVLYAFNRNIDSFRCTKVIYIAWIRMHTKKSITTDAINVLVLRDILYKNKTGLTLKDNIRPRVKAVSSVIALLKGWPNAAKPKY